MLIFLQKTYINWPDSMQKKLNLYLRQYCSNQNKLHLSKHPSFKKKYNYLFQFFHCLMK